MKTIKFVADAAQGLDTPTLLQLAVTNYAPQGITLAEQRKRIRILDALDKARGAEQLDLEDADFEVARACFVGFPFGMAHRDIVRTGDAIEAAAAA